MEVTPELRRLVHRGAAPHELRDHLKRSGFTSLRDEGVALAMDGKTSLDEVLRVTHNDDLSAAATGETDPEHDPVGRPESQKGAA
jgi:hypothetical protein